MRTFRTGQRVVYRPHPTADPERGVITEAYTTPTYHRVRYGTDIISKLTPHAALVGDETAEELVLGAAKAGLDAAVELQELMTDLISQLLSGRGSLGLVCKRSPHVLQAVETHRGEIAAATLHLDDVIRETLPLLSWVETGTAEVSRG